MSIGTYLDGLLKLLVNVYANGTYLQQVGAGGTGQGSSSGINVVSPLTVVPNTSTGNVDISMSSTLLATAIDLTPTAQPSAPGSGWVVWADSSSGLIKAINASSQVILVNPVIPLTSNTKILNANNTTAHVSVFTFTGTLRIVKLYALVTAALSSNITNVQFTVYDGTTRSSWSASTGCAMSSAPVGSTAIMGGLPTAALTYLASSGISGGAGSTDLEPFQETNLQANATATSYLEFSYTTTNTPASGAVQVLVQYEPLTSGAGMVAV